MSDVLVFCDFETTGLSGTASPIEVGLVFVDRDTFRELGRFQSFIFSGNPVVYSPFEEGAVWATKEGREAERIHNIRPVDVFTAPDGISVANDILETLQCFGDRRFILISDNIQFEWRYMERLMGPCTGLGWPFHYCGWDTSLFLEMTGVGDPPNPPHRALADTLMLVEACRKAWQSTALIRSASPILLGGEP